MRTPHRSARSRNFCIQISWQSCWHTANGTGAFIHYIQSNFGQCVLSPKQIMQKSSKEKNGFDSTFCMASIFALVVKRTVVFATATATITTTAPASSAARVRCRQFSSRSFCLLFTKRLPIFGRCKVCSHGCFLASA